MSVSRPLLRSTAAALALVLTAVSSEEPAAAQPSPSPFTTGYRYDVAGRLVGTIRPDDSVGTVGYLAERITYGAKGLPIRVETGSLSAWQSETVAPSAWTGLTIGSTVEFGYDSFGRKIQERRLAGGIVKLLTEFEYDDQDRLKCSAVRMDEPNFGSQPVAGCTPRSDGASGPDRITRFSYDNRDRITTIEKAVWTSDAQVYAAYTYNAGDKPLTVVDANGNKAELAYDGFERQTRWTFPSRTTPGQVNTDDYERCEYDSNGNRTLFRKRDNSTLTFAYDALDRMTVKVVPERSGLSAAQTRDVHYSYDLRGLQTRARFDNRYTGEGVDSSYDGFGRLASSTINLGGASRTLTYLNDANGNRTRITHPPAIVSTHPQLGPLSFYYNYQYDGLDRPILVTNAGGATVSGWSYDALGRLETIVRPGAPASTYGYDSLSRTNSIAHDLTGSAFDLTLTFQYNPANQIASRTSSNAAYDNMTGYNVSRPYAANGLNQYESAGTAQFAYDANGNLIADGSNAFVYDVENRLVSASGAKNAALVYDPLGRLFQVSGGASGPLQFLYDGDALVAEYIDLQTRSQVYVHGPGVDQPMVWYEGGYGGRRLYADHQGSIVAIAHPTNAWLAINGYDSWGIPNPSNAGRFQYTGQVWLPELGMYYYKARVYSPTLGRFLQTDPIGYEDQMNLYAYVGNDPMNWTDPFGLDNCQVKQDDGKLVDIPNCKGDKKARPATPEELQEINDAGTIVVTAMSQKGSAHPEDMDLGTLVQLPGEFGFATQDGKIFYVPTTASCVQGKNQVGHFNASQFAGTDSGGHTHGSDILTGLGDDDAHMAAIHPKKIGVQADRDGVRTVDRLSGSYRAILHGKGSSWGDLGAAGTQQRVNGWNKPAKGGGLSGNKAKAKCS